jgi:hypothetical protein
MQLIPTDLQATKEVQKELAAQIIDSVKDGNESALKVAAKIKFVTDALEEVKKEIQPLVVDELSLYDKRERVTVLGGYTVEVKEMGVKYNFSQCGHPRWTQIDEEIKALNEERKAIEATLKTLKGKTIVVDEETGETFELYPPSKQSSTTPVFSFGK